VTTLNRAPNVHRPALHYAGPTTSIHPRPAAPQLQDLSESSSTRRERCRHTENCCSTTARVVEHQLPAHRPGRQSAICMKPPRRTERSLDRIRLDLGPVSLRSPRREPLSCRTDSPSRRCRRKIDRLPHGAAGEGTSESCLDRNRSVAGARAERHGPLRLPDAALLKVVALRPQRLTPAGELATRPRSPSPRPLYTNSSTP